MNLKPSENIKIYGMEIFFKEIVKLYNKKKCLIKFYYLEKKEQENQH